MPGALVISLDFELRWGVLDRVLQGYAANLRGARDAVVGILELFARYDIHATWAVVGLLCCESRDQAAALVPRELPQYDDPRLSAYGYWSEVGRDETDDPLHFAPSLVRRIAAQPGQFVGTHTFSHYYCLEPGQTAAAFCADLRAAAAAMAPLGLQPRSIVFPRNQVNPEYLGLCAAAGLGAYRGAQAGWHWRATRTVEQTRLRRAVRLVDAYLPVVATGRGAVDAPADARNVRGSRFLAPYRRGLRQGEALRLRRIGGEMRRAAANGETYHLWWHPHNFGVNQRENMDFLEAVLHEFDGLRRGHGMVSASMEEAAGLAAATPLAAVEGWQ